MSKIVVVEDSTDLRRAVEEALAAAGHEVLAERSGRVAIGRLEAETPDLVVTALELPDLDGLQVCTFVKQSPILSATPVLILARGRDEEARRRARRAGAAAVLEPPFDAAQLVGETRRLLGLGPLPGDGVGSPEASREAHEVSPVLPAPGPPTTAEELGFAAFDDLPVLDLAPPAALAPEPDFELEPDPSFELEPEPEAAPPTPAPAPVSVPGSAPEAVGERETWSGTTHRFAGLLDELAAALDLRFGCLLHTTDGAVRRIGEVPRLETTIGADVIRMALLASAVSAQVGQGRLQNVIVESGEGTMLIQRLPESHLLVLGVADASALGKARYLMRKVRLRLDGSDSAG